MSYMNAKRQARANRKVTTKGEPYGRCIHQEYTEKLVETGEFLKAKDENGEEVKVPVMKRQARVKYLHVTKGWRDRLA